MKEKRNGNVEAFRIVLMAGIVSLHILGHGHLLELSILYGTNRSLELKSPQNGRVFRVEWMVSI